MGGWEVSLDGTVPYDQEFVVDTLANTVTRVEDGASMAHLLTFRSDLSARLPAGASEVIFTGTDETNTAWAQVEYMPVVAGI